MAKVTAIGILILVIGIASKQSFADDCTNLSAFDRLKGSDCYKYKDCSKGDNPTEEGCVFGLAYDDATKSCIWANQVPNCVPASGTQVTDNWEGTKTGESGPCKTDTTKAYNAMIDDCVAKETYVCITNERLPDCSDDTAGYTDTAYISDKENCAGYFRCIKGVRYAGECPSGYYFNAVKQMCSYMNKDTKCTTLLAKPSTTDDFDYDNVCKGKAGQFVADPRHCQAYFYCSTETTKRQAFCDTGKYFNAGKCSSTPPSSCTCEKFDWTTTTMSVKIIAHPDETKFYTCKKGQRIEGQCASGKWNSTLESCTI